ncbi:2-amino-4-hydroxy-6-hydroxymethyldihydropteridine diphosphokinase [Cellulomonas shaoxiangyii]|uniref:Bifunctional folate synthesis protein n=1 Tax=Cellulomonas shaoxiangyii TaxID=2566013 RepID=A0A4P7SK91_9CELL|nr:2-amino-4-hydroxy-6-hydroxymethyldihydropteridine diphosphokinase [Cellulomonas shaoxiangyii]QCB94622.1 2-amino-4-hydroxy-6-hydroxymethyldihydropteridine diphosphokinase [Cellulomonas shaoxiangyii]TGY78895.1 2-amino-4-hydroxy-6-hydroxymethyldihydropteridine diphosphokinase [Cellulomonas shaoxiangyii]
MSAQDDVQDGGGRRLDQIRLEGIRATGYHGVFAHERREGQTFVADVVVHLDTRRAAATDDLAHTLNYGTLAEHVAAVLAGDPADLIETVAERIAATVLVQPHVHAVDVAVHKPQAPITVPFGDVVVSIRRDRTKLPAAEPYRPSTGEPRRAPAGPRQPLLHPPTAPLPVTPAPGVAVTTEAADLPRDPAELPVELPGGVEVGPDGSGPLVVAPAPTGAVPTGVLPAVAAGAASPPAGLPVHGGPRHEPDHAGAGEGGAPAHDDASADARTQLLPPVRDEQPAYPPQDPRPEPFADAHTQLMPPVDDDVVEGDVLSDELDRAPATAVETVLALGANLGPAQETLRRAVSDLAAVPGLEIVAVSPLARTASVGGPEQPDYLNAVVLARTTLAPRELLRAVHAVEHRHGRERLERWGPRTLDIDIVVHGTTLAVADDLELPHPRAHERAFVLEPWAQVDPEAVLPGLGGGPVARLAATAPDRDGVRWMALDWLTAPVPAASPEPGGPDAGETVQRYGADHDGDPERPYGADHRDDADVPYGAHHRDGADRPRGADASPEAATSSPFDPVRSVDPSAPPEGPRPFLPVTGTSPAVPPTAPGPWPGDPHGDAYRP